MPVALSMYCLCKHGPGHEDRRGGGACGYAHSLGELDHPVRGQYRPLQWVCRAHERGGPGGIDLFVGQEFGPEQMQRYLMYLTQESLSTMPLHCKMFAWYHELHSAVAFCDCGDFGFRECISRLSRIWPRNVNERDVLDYQHWPFDQMRINGHTLVQRLREREESAVTYQVYKCEHVWADVSGLYRIATEQTSGPMSRPYLGITCDRMYVRLGEEHGWWLVVCSDLIHEADQYAGWAPPSFFASEPSEQRVYHDMPGTMSSVLGVDRVEARILGAEVVAICDGSPDQGEGFAAAFVCTGIPLAGRCSLRLQMDGSETAELGSMLLALLHVFQAQAERPLRLRGIHVRQPERCEACIRGVGAFQEGRHPPLCRYPRVSVCDSASARLWCSRVRAPGMPGADQAGTRGGPDGDASQAVGYVVCPR